MEDGSSGVSEKQQGHWQDAEVVNQEIIYEAHTRDRHGNSTVWDKISKQTGHLRWSIADKVWVAEICGRGDIIELTSDLMCSMTTVSPCPFGRPGCLGVLTDFPPVAMATKCSQSCI